MKHGAVARALAEEDTSTGDEPLSARRPAGLAAVRATAFDEARRTLTLRVGREQIEATLDASVEPAVIHTALRRGERLLAQPEGEGWVVIGALRTTATPGVDEADEFLIKANRVAVVAAHEFAVVTGAASFAMRAIGHVETLAQDITTRASSLHKLVGRMIRLN
jgi:hypothetical protein